MRDQPDWQICKSDFAWDGSWRDIYVFGTTASDWEKLLRSLDDLADRAAFSACGAASELPRTFDQASWTVETRPLLQLHIGPVLLCCHFFAEDEIEFDLDPRDVTDAAALDRILGFMKHLGELLGKAVYLTPENMPETSILEYSPEAGAVRKFDTQRDRAFD
jgi:hypothetical protein